MRTDFSVNNGVNFGSSFYDRFFQKLPNKEIRNLAKYNRVGKALASPHWNRLTLGVAAISSQPFIDYFNPKVDRDTAKASTIRTISKIGVCTSVGFTVRGLCYKLTEKFTNDTAGRSSFLTPKAILETVDPIARKNKLKLHKNALSTIIALTVMMFTNVLLDAPLTTLVSNKLLSKAGLAHIKKGENNDKS